MACRRPSSAPRAARTGDERGGGEHGQEGADCGWGGGRGASCAARLRRLDESAEIAVFDRGPHVSFANCGLPYFVGDVMREERSLLVASEALSRDRFAIDVHVRHEVTAIDRERRTI